MNGAIRFILCLVIVVSLMAIEIESAFACSCAMPGPVDTEIDRAMAVFSGKVVSLESPKGKVVSSADPVLVTFQVYQVWKGPTLSTITITTARSGSSCGYEFNQGQEYLVYADGSANSLEVSLCSRTQPIEGAVADLRVLGEGITSLVENPEMSWGLPYLRIEVLALTGSGLFLLVIIGAVIKKRYLHSKE